MSCYKNSSNRWTFRGANKSWETEKEARVAYAVFKQQKKDLVEKLLNKS